MGYALDIRQQFQLKNGLGFPEMPGSSLEPEPEADEDQADQAQMEVLEAVCPEPLQEVPEGTENLEPVPDEPAPDAEEEAEQEEMAHLLRETRDRAHAAYAFTGAGYETGAPATESAMAHPAGYIARKRGPSFGARVAASEDVPV